jgi:hypothetical protein
MREISVTLGEGRHAFEPGEVIEGTASWRLDAPPERIEVRLFYFTRGKGTRDVEVVKVVSFPSGAASGDQRFSFVAPEQPHSFSGRLITLVWAIELVVEPGALAERVELVIAPDAREIELHTEALQPVQ